MYDAKLLTAAEHTVVSLTLDRRIDSSRSDGWPSASALPTAVAPRVRSAVLPRFVDRPPPPPQAFGNRGPPHYCPHWYDLPADVLETADILHVKPWEYAAAERSPCERITVVLPDMPNLPNMPAGQVFQLKIVCDYLVSLVDARYAPVFVAHHPVAGFVSLMFFNDKYYVEYAR